MNDEVNRTVIVAATPMMRNSSLNGIPNRPYISMNMPRTPSALVMGSSARATSRMG